MSQEVMDEVLIEVDQDVEREKAAMAVGSAENDELEVKTQENHHPRPTSQHEKNEETQEMSLRYGIRYEKWSGDTSQVWMTRRRARVKVEVYEEKRRVTSMIQKRDNEQRRK